MNGCVMCVVFVAWAVCCVLFTFRTSRAFMAGVVHMSVLPDRLGMKVDSPLAFNIG